MIVIIVVQTDNKVALVVIYMDLSIGHSKQQDLAIRRPSNVGQLDPLQLLSPDSVSCTTSTEEESDQIGTRATLRRTQSQNYAKVIRNVIIYRIYTEGV